MRGFCHFCWRLLRFVFQIIYLRQTGGGVWFHNDDAEGVHARLVDAGVAIAQEPFEGPFGLQFSFRDPDGYVVTIHARA